MNIAKLAIRIISKIAGDDRRIQGAKGSRNQGKIIKTAKSNWLRYPSGMKYAILFTVGARNQGSNKNLFGFLLLSRKSKGLAMIYG